MTKLKFWFFPVLVVAATGIFLRWTSAGKFTLVHDSPILQSLTRAALLHEGPDGRPAIYFSTLEHNKGKAALNMFQWVSLDPTSLAADPQIGEGSIEVRGYAYCPALRRYVLGSSLGPQLFLFDPKNHRHLDRVPATLRNGRLRRLFGAPALGVWIHQLAVHGDDAYVLLSAPQSSESKLHGIIRVNLRSGRKETIPFPDSPPQSYGGVQTVDPTGRIWFYQAYPFRLMWFDRDHGPRERNVSGLERWAIESWDVFNGEPYLVLTDSRGHMTKKRVVLPSLTLRDDAADPSPQQRRFMDVIPVDFYHNAGPSLSGLYFHPASESFYWRRGDGFSLLGKISLGSYRTVGRYRVPQESPLLWMHAILGEIQILGLSPEHNLVLWLTGRKAFAVADLRRGHIKVHDIAVTNLSAADITSLVAMDNGLVYGAGYLTMSDMFQLDLTTRQSRILRDAIPNGEGQINSMFKGVDGKIYGAGYPDSVLFRFDPSLPWNPGATAASNPLNLGAMGHRRQMRAHVGVQSLDGNVWYQSVTDYEVPVAHALARADFRNRTLTVKTDIDDGIPRVYGMAVFDGKHLALLGSRGNDPGIYLLEQTTFRIVKSQALGSGEGLLVNLAPLDPMGTRLFLAQGRSLYHVRRDLSTELVHRAPTAILRIVAGRGSNIFLIGRRHIETLDLESGNSHVDWAFLKKPGGRVFSGLDWKQAVSLQGTLLIADGHQLWRYDTRPDAR